MKFLEIKKIQHSKGKPKKHQKINPKIKMVKIQRMKVKKRRKVKQLR